MANFAFRRRKVAFAPAALKRGLGFSLAFAALLAPLGAAAQGTAPPVRPDSPSDPDAGRFLEEATFGPTQTDINHLRQIGLRAWINEQFSVPISDYNGISFTKNSPTYYARKRFFENAINKPDQLRQRVVFALQQFVVASTGAGGFEDTDKQNALQGYLDILNKNAFGNYRTLLYDISRNPMMGTFLNAANNDKPNPAKNSLPNENYARELLQLFSIGIYQLNSDGSLKLDGNQQPLSTYGNDEIKGFARVFTGWTYPTKPNASLQKHNPTYYGGPMVAYESNHDTAPKLLLGGVTIPGGSNTDTDLNAAIDNIFNHPNVGPFVCRRLIQHLVTSNPSPGYLSRVVSAFNNNGAGIRGDMRAVLNAILLDGEAVGGIKQNPLFGHLREPVLLMTNSLRPFKPTGDLFGIPDIASNLSQNVFNASSVFNFYGPDFALSTTDNSGQNYYFYSPESQLISTNTSLARINFINTLLYGTISVPTSVDAPPGSTSILLDLSPYDALSATPSALVSKLNHDLMRSAMPAQMASSITTAITATSPTIARDRVKAAIYLILSSMQFQTEGANLQVQTVQGTANLQATNKAQTLRFEFRPTNGDSLFTRLVTLDSSGGFALPYIPPGQYNLAVRGSVYLQKVVPIDTTNGDMTGLKITLLPGDTNGDNFVDSADFAQIVQTYGSLASNLQSGYDPQADLNCDGSIDVNDFALLINAYGETGDF